MGSRILCHWISIARPRKAKADRIRSQFGQATVSRKLLRAGDAVMQVDQRRPGGVKVTTEVS